MEATSMDTKCNRSGVFRNHVVAICRATAERREATTMPSFSETTGSRKIRAEIVALTSLSR